MKLDDILRKLSYNELASLSIGGEGSGQVQETSYPRLIDKVNDGLLEIYSRFLLSEKELLIQTLDWKSNYLLDKKYAVLDNTPNVTKYIIDSIDYPFLGDVINILWVKNESGDELPINDPEQYASVYTPQVNCLQITHPGFNQVYFVGYKASHTLLTYDEENIEEALEQEIQIPKALEIALRYKIASGIFSSMGGQDYTPKAQELEAKYVAACMEIEEQNLIGHPSMSTNVKLHRRGFI